MSDKVLVQPSVEEALLEFKDNDVSKGNSYFIFGYEEGSKNKMIFLRSQEGGLNDAIQAGEFPEREERYCLLRIQHQVEMAKTMKFALVTWYPEGLKPMRKALLSTHKGQVKDILKPWHVTLEATEPRELDEDEILDKIGVSSGTKIHETTKALYTAPKEMSSGGGLRSVQKQKTVGGGSGMQKGGADLSWVDEDEAESAFKAVKSDADTTDWLLLGYESAKKIKVLGTGSGGVSELASKLDDSQIYYGYFRVTEVYDKSVTVKFGQIKLMTNKVAPVMRAKCSTHQGFLQQYLSPSQVSFDLIDQADFSEEIVMAKLGATTGTRTNVTNKANSGGIGAI